MSVKFIKLKGEEQFGFFAQLLIRSDASLPKEELKVGLEQERILPTHIVFPLIKSMEDMPILADIFATQTMADPDIAIPIEILSEEESKRRSQEEFDFYSVDLAEGEDLKRYVYGGFLSERGGFYVIHKDRPDLVLRYAQTWMS